MKLVADFKTCYQEALRILQSEGPAFISRIGGSDTDAVVDYCRAKVDGCEAVAAHVSKFRALVSRYNGFYDRRSSPDTYLKYCETLLDTYRQSNILLFCNYQLLSLYFADILNPAFYKDEFENKEWYRSLINRILAPNQALRCYPYQFVEKMVFDEHTLFRVFSQALAGRTVLVVSPFAESIAANFDRRHTFFRKNYVYPEFELRLVNTPITYAGLPAELYPDEDWFATLESLRKAVSGCTFDVALLGCGSYAMPLGLHIERVLCRKAVYVGGVLQLYFGIMGRRYQNRFFLDQIHPENFIVPLERERYMKFVTIEEKTAAEAFGAYF